MTPTSTLACSRSAPLPLRWAAGTSLLLLLSWGCSATPPAPDPLEAWEGEHPSLAVAAHTGWSCNRPIVFEHQSIKPWGATGDKASKAAPLLIISDTDTPDAVDNIDALAAQIKAITQAPAGLIYIGDFGPTEVTQAVLGRLDGHFPGLSNTIWWIPNRREPHPSLVTAAHVISPHERPWVHTPIMALSGSAFSDQGASGQAFCKLDPIDLAALPPATTGEENATARLVLMADIPPPAFVPKGFVLFAGGRQVAETLAFGHSRDPGQKPTLSPMPPTAHALHSLSDPFQPGVALIRLGAKPEFAQLFLERM